MYYDLVCKMTISKYLKHITEIIQILQLISHVFLWGVPHVQ